MRDLPGGQVCIWLWRYVVCRLRGWYIGGSFHGASNQRIDSMLPMRDRLIPGGQWTAFVHRLCHRQVRPRLGLEHGGLGLRAVR